MYTFLIFQKETRVRFLRDYGGQENRKSIKTPRTQMT